MQDVRAGLAALEAAEREAAEAALHQWRDAEERAHVLAAAQQQYIEQQASAPSPSSFPCLLPPLSCAAVAD